LRKKVIRLVIYLDDILIMNSDRDDLTRDVEIVKSTLEEAGFIINVQKSETEPTQSIEFLGLIVDTVHSTLALTSGKKRQFCKHVKAFCPAERWLSGIWPRYWVTSIEPQRRSRLLKLIFGISRICTFTIQRWQKEI
jgi:hypothetical protein